MESRPASGLASNHVLPPRKKGLPNFIEALETDKICPVCSDFLRYPMKLGTCGHHLCSGCLNGLLRSQPRCPVDQISFKKDDATLDRHLNDEIFSAKVRCTKNEWGCRWEGELFNLNNHLEQCEYQEVYCKSDCGAKFQRRFQQKHIDKDCPKKIVSCEYCGERHTREEKKNHITDCPKFLVNCPNKCEKDLLLPRDEMNKHVAEDCLRTKILCLYEDIGCTFKSSRDKLPRHYKRGIIEHLHLVYECTKKNSTRLDQQQSMLAAHEAVLDQHRIHLGDLDKITKQTLVWRVDEVSRRIRDAKTGNVPTIFSPTFTTSKHGYRLCASLCLNGDGKGKNTHVSVFISILKGAYDSLLKWPFDYSVTFYLLDQNDDVSQRRNIKFVIKPNPCQENEPFLGRPMLEKNASFGGARFVRQETLENSTYVKDDTLFIKVIVDCDGCSEP